MDGGDMNSRRRVGSVKEAINLYRGKFSEGNSALEKSQMNFPEPSARTREFRLARRAIGRLNENQKIAESVKARAESELLDARETVRDLSLRIEESNSRAKLQLPDGEKLQKHKSSAEEGELSIGNTKDYRYAEVMRELKYVKQELSKLKLDMASILEEKRQAEKETEASSSKLRSYSISVEALTKEIEELNEEQVLVELARIEALKEFGVIEDQRKEEAKQYSSAMEETRKNMNDIIQEIDRSKELELKLAVTNSDVNVLQSELRQIKEMDKRIQKHEKLKNQEDGHQKGGEWESSSLLQSVTEELEAAKKELASIREEGFQFMASMDIVRHELKHVSEETAQLRKTEEKADLTIQDLNSKLLRAKTKLEAASAAEENAKSIVTNLSLTLEQLNAEAEAAKKEKVLTSEETSNVKAEVEKIESEIDLAEERLQAAMQELEAIKSSEAIALENLKVQTEITMRARAPASEHTSKITISNFEYEYLRGRAVGAEEIADKKVAAAQAWIEALKASEKELQMKAEIAQREIRELRVEEEKELYRTEKSPTAKRLVENERHSRWQKHEKNLEPENLQRKVTLPRKSTNRNGTATPARQAKFQKSASPAARHLPRSTSVTMRRRRRVMPSITKFFSNKRSERNV
ncbi:unnamed protein product [Ilex paraguariensis]|uniref:Protein PLASTID MOVEMENT IMPAIRED 2 n=1 Tax=Ilex paraguariensis TaxID=185542 RepID=A0ABC8R7G1_9AQUA